MTSLMTVLPHLPANIPSPPQGVWEIGPVPLRAYALCIIAGIIVAIWWGDKRWQARGGQAGFIVDVGVWAVPFGLIGGRIYHVMTDAHIYFGDGPKGPIDALKIWDGGLGIWGAIALGGVGAWIACRRHGVPLPAFADAVAPGIVVAQAIGRVGNYFNQELYGGPTDLPWGLEIYERIPDNITGVSNGVLLEVVHPTFLYELLWSLLVAVVVVWADRKFRLGHGRAFAVYVAGYTLGRTWIELMRTDPATQVLGQRINVWVSLLVFLGAIAYIVLARKRGDREPPEALRGKYDDDTADEASADADEAGADEAGDEDAAREDADAPADGAGDDEAPGKDATHEAKSTSD